MVGRAEAGSPSPGGVAMQNVTREGKRLCFLPNACRVFRVFRASQGALIFSPGREQDRWLIPISLSFLLTGPEFNWPVCATPG